MTTTTTTTPQPISYMTFELNNLYNQLCCELNHDKVVILCKEIQTKYTQLCLTTTNPNISVMFLGTGHPSMLIDSIIRINRHNTQLIQINKQLTKINLDRSTQLMRLNRLELLYGTSVDNWNSDSEHLNIRLDQMDDHIDEYKWMKTKYHYGWLLCCLFVHCVVIGIIICVLFVYKPSI